MGLNTATIAVHTAPTVISTFLHHISGGSKREHARRNKKALRAAQKTTDAGASVDASANPDGVQLVSRVADVQQWPDEHLLYDEGLQIIKKFLETAKDHTVEELQAFTAMHVPNPSWIHLTHATIPADSISLAARILTKHFGDVYGGVDDLGGEHWWTLRGRDLEGEWIEMKKDYLARTVDKAQVAVGEKEQPYRQDEKVILYCHGGAYHFASVGTMRYQIQRHARKLGGRAFAPSYRQAPQYPFPCGLQDALASYLFLVSPPAHSTHPAISPANIVLSGDSAGAGLILSLLCVIRDSGGQVPMPAGATLVSPWVDLTHSFRSIMEDDSMDYIPSDGFSYKASLAWPPIPGDGIPIKMTDPETGEAKTRVLDEQVQQYAANDMLAHPLVTPINQGSLGGLCPLMILGGSGELLRDEIIFLAHKAANPAKYPPSDAVLARYPGQKEMISKFPPTKVHLSMVDGVAHVTPTFSFTGPAKVMYRAAANFGLWAITAAGVADDLAHEKHQRRKHHTPKSSGTTSVASAEPMYGTTLTTKTGEVIAAPMSDAVHDLANERTHEDVYESEASSSSESESDDEGELSAGTATVSVTGTVPHFVDSMVRERVSVRGEIRPMEPVEECATFIGLDLQSVGSVHGSGPILKWLASREKSDKRHAKELKHFREIRRADRAKAEQEGFLTRNLHGERPPLASLAGWYSEEHAASSSHSVDGMGVRSQGGKSVTGAVALWMRMGEKDESKQAKKPAQEAKVDAMRQKLDDLGIDRAEQDKLGDKKVNVVRDQLEEQGVDVVRQKVPEVGPAGESLAAVGQRLDADNSVPTQGQAALPPIGARPGDVAAGAVKKAPTPKDVVSAKIH